MMQQTAITVDRQVRTGDKTAYSTVATGFAYIKPMTEEQTSSNGYQYGKGHVLLCDIDTTIKESDRVTANSIVYTVRGVARHARGPHKFIKALLVEGI